MKRFILILVTTVQLLSSLYYKNCLFYVFLSLFWWFVLGLAAYVFCLHTKTIKSLNGNRCQFIYYARLSLHTILQMKISTGVGKLDQELYVGAAGFYKTEA